MVQHPVTRSWYCVCISQRWRTCVCVYGSMGARTATVPVAHWPMKSVWAVLTSWLIHKMGSGVQSVKWLLCGFPHAQPASFHLWSDGTSSGCNGEFHHVALSHCWGGGGDDWGRTLVITHTLRHSGTNACTHTGSRVYMYMNTCGVLTSMFNRRLFFHTL